MYWIYLAAGGQGSKFKLQAVRNAAEIHCVYRAYYRKRVRCGPRLKPGKPAGRRKSSKLGTGPTGSKGHRPPAPAGWAAGKKPGLEPARALWCSLSLSVSARVRVRLNHSSWASVERSGYHVRDVRLPCGARERGCHSSGSHRPNRMTNPEVGCAFMGVEDVKFVFLDNSGCCKGCRCPALPPGSFGGVGRTMMEWVLTPGFLWSRCSAMRRRSAAISGTGSGVGLLISASSGLRRFGLRARCCPIAIPFISALGARVLRYRSWDLDRRRPIQVA
jgi:hypothetical protein